ncbi:hypothetical protein N7463_009151 [Penicillium fimorum]|uniref:Leucine-rich repeat domain-containing protein n=1 Tax=Penicillium fimorum TaxID=1882269 RepID=A0A9W9XRQ4_9EURO|nr:hypothetical protein N7463_009151 [Penicillium fimorum]
MTVLNNDIFLLISEHIYDQQDKTRLLLVCRDWYSLFLPKVYRRVSLKSDQIYPLVRSIQKNPRIGPSIRHLWVEWEGGHDSDEGAGIEIDELLKTLGTSESDESLDEWKAALRFGCADAWLVVLVLSVEFVKSMDMNASYSGYFFPMLGQIIKGNAFGSKPPLQHLEIASVWTDDMKTHYMANDLLPFFSLPAMREFNGGGICEFEDDNSEEPVVTVSGPGTSKITTINIGGHHSNNGCKGMADFIHSCANLEIFDYQHDNKAIWGEIYLDIRPLLFYRALYSHRHSLRELRLNNQGEDESIGFDEGNDGRWNGFGSLAEFHQLRELQIPFCTLLQFGTTNQPRVSLVEILPSSLEYLNLSYCDDENFDLVIKNLSALLARREQFPNIKKLEVKPLFVERIQGVLGEFRVPASTQQRFAPIGMICRELGIDFGFNMHGTHRLL